VLGGHASDPLMLRIMSALAAAESDLKSERQKAKHLQMSESREYAGGRRRWGYSNGKILDEDGNPIPAMTILPAEAAVISAVADRLLAGETLAGVARWLNANGHLTPLGNQWNGTDLRVTIRRPHLAGKRVYHGEVIGEASWEPVLDAARYEALCHKLSDKRRRKSFSNATKYLLSGLAVCGICEGTIRGKRRVAKVKAPVVSYTCVDCGGVNPLVEDVDQRVSDYVTARLALMDARGLLVDDAEAQQLATLEADRGATIERHAATGRLLADGKLSPEGFAVAVSALDDRLRYLDGAITAAREAIRAPVRELDGLTGPDPEVTFAGLPLARQRAVISLLCQRVTIEKRIRGTRPGAFNPEQVTITPK